MKFDDLTLIFDEKTEMCAWSYGSNPNNLAIYEAIFSLIMKSADNIIIY